MRAFLLGVVAGYGIAIPLGAIAVMIVQVGMRCGFRCGASAGAGAATADLLYALLAVTAGAVLARTVEAATTPLRWASAAVLVAIAVRGLLHARREPAAGVATLPGPGEYARTYLKFLALTVVNPLTVVYFSAIVLGLGLADDLGPVGGALFVAGAFLASLSWQTFLAATGSVLRQRVPERARLAAVVAGNLVVVALALLVLTR